MAKIIDGINLNLKCPGCKHKFQVKVDMNTCNMEIRCQICIDLVPIIFESAYIPIQENIPKKIKRQHLFDLTPLETISRSRSR